MGTKEQSAKAIGEEEKSVASILNDFANRPGMTDFCRVSLFQLALNSDSEAAKNVAKKLADIPNPSNSQISATISHYLGNKRSAELKAKQDNETNTIGLVRIGVRVKKLDFKNDDGLTQLTTSSERFDSFLKTVNDVNGTKYTKVKFSEVMRDWQLERVHFDSEGKRYDKDMWVWTYKGEGKFDPYDDATIGLPTHKAGRRMSEGSFRSRFSNNELVKFTRQINRLKRKPTDAEVKEISPQRNTKNVMAALHKVYKTYRVELLLKMASFQAVVRNGESSLPTVIAKQIEEERKADVTRRVVAESKHNPASWKDSDVYQEALDAKVTKASLEKAVKQSQKLAKQAAKKSSKKKMSKSLAVGKENKNPVENELTSADKPTQRSSTSKRPASRKDKAPASKQKSSPAMKRTSTNSSVSKVKAGKAKAKRKSSFAVLGDGDDSECEYESKSVSRSKKFCSRGMFDDRCMEVKNAVDELEDYVPSSDESDNDDD